MITSEGFEVPFELNTEIKEDIEIEVPDIVDGKFSTKKEKATRRTIYIDVKPQLAMCDWADHTFIPKKTAVGNFQCTKCQYIKLAEPNIYKFVDGKLLPR